MLVVVQPGLICSTARSCDHYPQSQRALSANQELLTEQKSTVVVFLFEPALFLGMPCLGNRTCSGARLSNVCMFDRSHSVTAALFAGALY